MKKTFGYINKYINKGRRQLKRTLSLRKFKAPRNIPEIVVALSYSQLYDDYSKVNPKTFLEGIPTFDVLRVILSLECTVHYTLHNPEEDAKHISRLLHYCDANERQKVLTIAKMHKKNLVFINNEGTMRFVRLALNCYEPDIVGYKLNNDDYKNILKAYLYCNQIWTNEQLNNRLFAYHNLVDASLRIDLPFSEFKMFKDFRTQMFKAIRFFQFAENSAEIKPILDKFCVDRQVQDWKEYIRILFGFFEASMNTSVVDMSTAPKQVIDFMKPFIVDIAQLPLNEPLTGKLPDCLRNTFLLKSVASSNLVQILSSDLLVDKIYQGLKFDFVAIADKYNLKTAKGNKISQVTFNSMLGADFSEHEILYSILDLIYAADDTLFRKSGKETCPFFNEAVGGSEPDYYLRDGNKLILFENKDVLFPVTEKFSRQLLRLKQSISYKIARFGKYPVLDKKKNKTLIKDQKEGLGQIFFNIYRLISRKEIYRAFDPEVDGVDTIYPVLVTYDNAYSALGVNAYANKKVSGIRKRVKKHFQEKYNIEVNPKGYEIKKPVIVDIDTLIMYSLVLRQQKLNLFELLDEYNSLVDKYDHNLSSFTTFIIDHHKLGPQGIEFIQMLYSGIIENDNTEQQ